VVWGLKVSPAGKTESLRPNLRIGPRHTSGHQMGCAPPSPPLLFHSSPTIWRSEAGAAQAPAFYDETTVPLPQSSRVGGHLFWDTGSNAGALSLDHVLLLLAEGNTKTTTYGGSSLYRAQALLCCWG
jgi:hypothetical protein